ncbi:hypothetical protein SAMN02910353_02917 [Ruminococcus sp. YRD2003]|uniref:hypothetical protein n=1 Tax=Ruminococcus sp. YRD2003 TaxID=1452313 RepID=UPI0008B6CC9C|nr:hypothetical protein SAMN02910353_02917 [Ruminococcus flavefaciens]
MSNKILKIGRPYIKDSDNGVRLYSDLSLDNKKYTIWYEFDSKYKNAITFERIDGIVVNVLLYAMEHSLDITSDQPITEELMYSLENSLIPAISKNIHKYKRIKLLLKSEAGTLSNDSGVNAVGASASGGVDSFYTLLKHTGMEKSDFNVTHLTFFNAGASGAFGGDKARERYHERIDWIKSVADELGLEMVCVDTNINEFLKQGHEATNTYRTLAIPLLMQKLFSKYYFASSYEFAEFKFKETDTSFYDILNLPCLSTPNLKFYLSGAEVSRNEKLQFISKYPITYNKLNVCVAQAHNCSKCDKCRRTMIALYGLKKLDLYKNVFDVDYFNKHKHEYFRIMMALRSWKEVPVWHEWNDNYKLVRREVSLLDRFLGKITLLYRVMRRKIYKTSFGKSIYEKYVKKD